MANVRGCNLPDDLYYLIERHVWAKPMGGGVTRVGITAVAGKLAGGKLAAITVKAKAIGQPVQQSKSIATVESSKFVGPVPAPISGVLLHANEKLAADPDLAIRDPYGEGWVAEMQAGDWDGEKTGLATGASGIAAYQAEMEAKNITCG
jgi:glycine cleavage system H protein